MENKKKTSKKENNYNIILFRPINVNKADMEKLRLKKKLREEERRK